MTRPAPCAEVHTTTMTLPPPAAPPPPVATSDDLLTLDQQGLFGRVGWAPPTTIAKLRWVGAAGRERDRWAEPTLHVRIGR